MVADYFSHCVQTTGSQGAARLWRSVLEVFQRNTINTHAHLHLQAWRRRIPALDLLDLIGIIQDKALSMWSDLSLMPVLLFSCQVCLGVWDCISYLCSIQQRLIQWEWTAVTSGAKCWLSFANTISSVSVCCLRAKTRSAGSEAPLLHQVASVMVAKYKYGRPLLIQEWQEASGATGGSSS